MGSCEGVGLSARHRTLRMEALDLGMHDQSWGQMKALDLGMHYQPLGQNS